MTCETIKGLCVFPKVTPNSSHSFAGMRAGGPTGNPPKVLSRAVLSFTLAEVVNHG